MKKLLLFLCLLGFSSNYIYANDCSDSVKRFFGENKIFYSSDGSERAELKSFKVLGRTYPVQPPLDLDGIEIYLIKIRTSFETIYITQLEKFKKLNWYRNSVYVVNVHKKSCRVLSYRLSSTEDFSDETSKEDS